jgi:hypothetical protein
MLPKVKGEITEAILLAKFIERGEVVLLPWGDNQRFDMVLYRNNSYLRIQCKTGRIKNNAIRFNVKSTNWNTLGQYSYKGQIDYFAVYCPENKKCYLISVDDVGITEANLRLEIPKNGQKEKIKFAKDFEI